MPPLKPKITFELQYDPRDRLPWRLRAYRRRTFLPREYVAGWFCATEKEALDIIEKFRKIPLLQVFE